jgi:hypothetical protein
VIKVRFIKDGKEGIRSRWRYKKGDIDLLQDSMAIEAIEDGIAIDIGGKVERSINTNAIRSLEEAKKRSLK